MSSINLKSLALTAIAFSTLAGAHRPHGHESFNQRRASHGGHGSSVGGIGTKPTITNCPDNSIPEVTEMLSNFPKPQTIATLIDGDDVASQWYNKILNTPEYKAALAIAPRGSNMGDFSNVTYDYGKDEDCWWTGTTCHSPKKPYLEVDTFTCEEPDTWGLSFDDGPFCDNDDFYDFLQTNKLKATMFYIGTNIANNPAKAQRGLKDGHEICVHTWSHHYMTSLTNEQVFSELYYTRKIIKNVLGITPKFWRPPFGDVDDRVRTFAHALGMKTVIWNHDTFDWSVFDTSTPAQVLQNYQAIYGNASETGGVIVLNHELNADTIGLFENQYPKIEANFKNIVPVATCTNVSTPYVETNISYPTFAQWISGTQDPTQQIPYVSDVEIDQTPVPDANAASHSSARASNTKGGKSGPAATNVGAASPQNSDSSGASRQSAITSVLAFVVLVAGAVAMA